MNLISIEGPELKAMGRRLKNPFSLCPTPGSQKFPINFPIDVRK